MSSILAVYHFHNTIISFDVIFLRVIFVNLTTYSWQYFFYDHYLYPVPYFPIQVSRLHFANVFPIFYINESEY